MTQVLKDRLLILFFLLPVVGILISVYVEDQKKEEYFRKCSEVRGEVLELYRDRLCVREGLILKI